VAKIAFIFSGQGAQYPGMGRELFECSPAARKVFAAAERVRPGTAHQCFEGTKEELSLTVNTQPCVFTVNLAAAAALEERGVFPDAAAGFSLGELSALAFTRVLPTEKAFALVCLRAREMQACAEETESAMAAVIGLTDEVVEEVCREFAGVFPVNYNCPGQIVLAGEKQALTAACLKIKECGGRAMPLPVNGAFHTPFMAKAAENLRIHMKKTVFRRPAVPLYANVTARPYAGKYAELLAGQVISPVLWQKTVENMAEAGVGVFVEAGPGKTLSGFVRRTLPNAEIYHVEDKNSLEETLEQLGGVTCLNRKSRSSQGREGALAAR